MWVAKFRLKDDDDIYSPLCEEFNVSFHATPYTHFEKENQIHLVVGGILIGNSRAKDQFVHSLTEDERIIKVSRSKDFILVRAAHAISREIITEITTFYNPQFILKKPVHVGTDGWERWEVCCDDRELLNELVSAAKTHYHGQLNSIRDEEISGI